MYYDCDVIRKALLLLGLYISNIKSILKSYYQFKTIKTHCGSLLHHLDVTTGDRTVGKPL